MYIKDSEIPGGKDDLMDEMNRQLESDIAQSAAADSKVGKCGGGLGGQGRGSEDSSDSSSDDGEGEEDDAFFMNDGAGDGDGDAEGSEDDERRFGADLLEESVAVQVCARL